MKIKTNELTLMQIAQRFSTEGSAREYFEHLRWPEGPVCPHCGNADQKRIYKVTANPEKKIRAGLYKCAECKRQFTVTVGTVCEDSHTPLNKWLMAFYVMCSSETHISAYQIKRRLKLGSHQNASFMRHRISYALQQLNQQENLNSTAEADGTYVGGKKRRSGMGRSMLETRRP